jgi:hypothetical protein
MAKNNIRDIHNKSGIEDLTQASFGQSGFRIIDENYVIDADERFFCLMPLTDSVLTFDSNTGGDSFKRFRNIRK